MITAQRVPVVWLQEISPTDAVDREKVALVGEVARCRTSVGRQRY